MTITTIRLREKNISKVGCFYLDLFFATTNNIIHNIVFVIIAGVITVSIVVDGMIYTRKSVLEAKKIWISACAYSYLILKNLYIHPSPPWIS